MYYVRVNDSQVNQDFNLYHYNVTSCSLLKPANPSVSVLPSFLNEEIYNSGYRVGDGSGRVLAFWSVA